MNVERFLIRKWLIMPLHEKVLLLSEINIAISSENDNAYKTSISSQCLNFSFIISAHYNIYGLMCVNGRQRR